MDCTKSVRWVDHFYLIHTGPSADKACDRAKAFWGDRVTVVPTDQAPYRWCSQGRNQCLRVAAEGGFDWAILIDTDMRLLDRWEDVRGFLAKSQSDVVSAWYAGKPFNRPCAFRLPACGTWEQDPHEYYLPRPTPPVLLPQARWTEGGWTEETWQARARWLISEFKDREPTARNLWWLATAHQEARNRQDAIWYYRACLDAGPAPELGIHDLSAWCLWRIACLEAREQDWQGVDKDCSEAIRVGWDYPEFYWLRGLADFHCRRFESAEAQAQAARVSTAGGRTSWTDQRAWYDGPLDLLYWCALEAGKPVEDLLLARDRALALRLADC